MAKKAAKAPASPEEWAKEWAQKLTDVNAQMKSLSETKEDLTFKLRQYVEETGQVDVGILEAYQKANPVALRAIDDGLTATQLKYAEAELINELSDFVKKSLDLTKMWAAHKFSPVIQNALSAKKLELVQLSSIQFRLRKENPL